MTKATSNTSSWRTALIGYRYFIVGALAFALYVNTLGHDFTLDDAIVIYDNDFTKTGFSGIPELLQFDTFRGFFKVEGKENLVAGGRYRPLTLIMFAMEYQIFGNSPWAFHLISVLLYSLLCVVLLYFLETLFQEKKTFWILAAVLIFVTHPIHTEVVANIKGRDEILSLLFGMCALTSLLNKKIIWTILFSFLACMSKEMAVTWLPISILSLLIIRRYSLIDSIKSTWPLASGIGLYLVLRFSVLGFTTTSEPITEMLNNPFIKLVGSQYLPFSFGEWTSSIFLSLGKYIQLLCFPLTLTHDYYPRHLEVSNWSNWGSILSLIIYSSLTFLAFYWHKIKPKMSYSIAFYMVSLVLISNIIFPIGTHMGERFIFMASVGFSLFSALCLERYFPSKVFGIILALILVLFSMKTITRNSAWKNDKTLFLTDVRVSSNSAKCNNAVGGAIIDECLQQGGVDCNISDIDMAMKHLKKAIAIHPNYKTAHLILGNAYFIKKQYDDAILSYKNALGIDFSLQDAQKNLMLTYIAVAKEYGEKRGNPNKAIEYLKEAFTIDDSNIEVLRLLGIAFGIKGEYNQAIKYFKQIVLLDPSNAAAYLNLGISYNHLGENKIGQEYINKAQSLDPTILKK